MLNAATGLPIGLHLKHQAAVVSVAFSADGKTILTGSEDNTARLWDAATAQPLGQPMVHEKPLDSARFCNNGSSILTRTTDGTTRLWVIPTGLPMGHPLESEHTTRNVAFSADGKTVLTNEDGPNEIGLPRLDIAKRVRIWDASSGSPISRPAADVGRTTSQPSLHEGGVHVTLSQDGKALLTRGGKTIGRWDSPASQSIRPLIERRDVFDGELSPDMKTILTSGADHRARLWDVATGQPIGAALVHPCEGVPVLVDSAVYSPDGTTVATVSNDATDLTRVAAQSTTRLWHLPSLLDDDLPRITVWVETITGLAVSDEGRIYGLDAAAWRERRERLRTLGGPPKADSGWLFDPVLYGTDPTARARAWIERRRWPEAEAAFAEAIRARPLRRSVWIERGRYYAMRSQPEKASADFCKALALGDRDPRLLADVVASGEVLDRVLPLLPVNETTLLGRLLLLRADRLARRGRLEEAQTVLVRVVGLHLEEDERSTWRRLLGVRVSLPWWEEDEPLNADQMVGLLGCSNLVTSLLRKYEHTSNIAKANSIAWRWRGAVRGCRP